MKLSWKSVIGALVGALLFVFALGTIPGQGAIATSSAVQIPQALVIAVEALLFALITGAFIWLFEVTGLNLKDFAAPLAATLSAFLLGLAQQWIDLQPVTSDPFILMVLNVLAVVLAGIGGLYFRAKTLNKPSLL